MTGYTRQRLADIQNGSVVDSDDLNVEFDQVEGAFNSSTGHKHDGSAGEGAPITKLGPVQDVTVSTTALAPKTTATVDLGTSALKFKNIYFSGNLTGGAITGITDLAVADGGTGSSTASGARTNLGLGTIATQASSAVTITGGTITGITDLAVADGGTGASTASAARTNLGLAIGSDVQAWDADLDAIAALFKSDGSFIVGNGTTWVAESGATARASLGLGSIATQTSSNVTITGGSISGLTTLLAPDGTVSVPSIAADGDTNTGISFIGTDRIVFINNGTESARFALTGSFLVGQSTLSNPGNASTTVGCSVTVDGQIHGSADGNYSGSFNRNTSDGTAVRFAKGGTTVGTISVTGSATAYNTSSDYRLKNEEDWDDTFDPWQKVKDLANIQRFYSWKNIPDKVDLGWFAHELAEVVPNAVTGEKDGEEYQGRDDSKLIPILVAALAEAMKRIEALENA